jgi:hypothetical protein
MKIPTDFARDILKNKEYIELTPTDKFVPFLVQKYLSGVSPEYCDFINDLLNSRLTNWKNEQEIYNFLKLVVPKKSNVFFKYYGSPKSDDHAKKLDSVVTYLSNTWEISKREIYENLKSFPELEKLLVEENEKILKSKK